MTAVTADVNLRVFGVPVVKKFIMDSSIAQAWFRGEPLIIDQSADTTNVTPVHDVTHPHITATDVFVGIAAEGGSNVISCPEDLAHGVEAYIEGTIVGFKSSVYTTNADVGKTLYWESGALSQEGTDTPPIGKFMWAEGGYVYVKLVTAVCSGADS